MSQDRWNLEDVVEWMKTLPHQDVPITGTFITLREFTEVLPLHHEYGEKHYDYWYSDEPAEVLCYMDWYFLDTPPYPLPIPSRDDFLVLSRWAAYVYQEGNEINWPSTFVPPEIGDADYDEEEGRTVGTEMLF